MPVSLKNIGRQLKQDHTTIMHALHTINGLIETNHAATCYRMLLVDAELNTILLEKKQMKQITQINNGGKIK